MKTLAAAVLTTSTLFAGATFANTALNQNAIQNQNTALNGHAIATNTTVKAALAAKDDTKVKLTGSIVKYLGDERYLFRDATGVVQVEIDDDLWKGKAIHASTKLTLIGEVDVDNKPTRKVEIDVDEVQF